MKTSEDMSISSQTDYSSTSTADLNYKIFDHNDILSEYITKYLTWLKSNDIKYYKNIKIATVDEVVVGLSGYVLINENTVDTEIFRDAKYIYFLFTFDMLQNEDGLISDLLMDVKLFNCKIYAVVDEKVKGKGFVEISDGFWTKKMGKNEFKAFLRGNR